MKNHDKRNIALVHITVIALYLGGLLFLVACAAPVGVQDPVNGGISIYHDTIHAATCWVTSSHAISCLPDSVLKGY